MSSVSSHFVFPKYCLSLSISLSSSDSRSTTFNPLFFIPVSLSISFFPFQSISVYLSLSQAYLHLSFSISHVSLFYLHFSICLFFVELRLSFAIFLPIEILAYFFLSPLLYSSLPQFINVYLFLSLRDPDYSQTL